MDVPAPSSVAMRTVWWPIVTLCINFSPDFVVPRVLLSKNQNIFADGVGDTAINDIGVVSWSDVITTWVAGAGDMMTGV